MIERMLDENMSVRQLESRSATRVSLKTCTENLNVDGERVTTPFAILHWWYCEDGNAP